MSDGVLDPKAMDRLKEWGGAALPKKMVEIFLETTPERMIQIRDGLGTRNPREAELGAHSLKSSAGNVGAVHLQEAASRAEELAANDDLEGLQAHVPVLDAAFRTAERALKNLLDGMER